MLIPKFNQLFIMLNAAHNSEERSSSYILSKQTGKETFSKPNFNCSTNKQTENGTFSKTGFQLLKKLIAAHYSEGMSSLYQLAGKTS